MRDFYKERDVVFEERRMRTDDDPNGRLFEQFQGVAFVAHPYGRPVVGWPSDLQTFSATDAQQFFDKYYVASNMVVAVVGDVKAAEALPIIEKYFGRLPKLPSRSLWQPSSQRSDPSAKYSCATRHNPFTWKATTSRARSI